MKKVVLLIIILISSNLCSVFAGDTVSLKPTFFPSFRTDTINVSDVEVLKIEVRGNDTIKKTIEVKYKLDNEGRIITSMWTDSKGKNRYIFYTYQKYPEIYAFGSEQVDWFQIYKCNNRGQLIEFSNFEKLKEKDSYWKTNTNKYTYNEINKKLESKIVNNLQISNLKSQYFYDEKSRLKKFIFSQDLSFKKDTVLKDFNYSISDSSFSQYSIVENDTTTITYTHKVFYNFSYITVAEKESKLLSRKSGKKYYLSNFETYYSFDNLGRLNEIKTIHIPEKSNPIYQSIKKYHFNTDKPTNIKSLDIENGS